MPGGWRVNRRAAPIGAHFDEFAQRPGHAAGEEAQAFGLILPMFGADHYGLCTKQHSGHDGADERLPALEYIGYSPAREVDIAVQP